MDFGIRTVYFCDLYCYFRIEANFSYNEPVTWSYMFHSFPTFLYMKCYIVSYEVKSYLLINIHAITDATIYICVFAPVRTYVYRTWTPSSCRIRCSSIQTLINSISVSLRYVRTWLFTQYLRFIHFTCIWHSVLRYVTQHIMILRNIVQHNIL